MGEKESAILNLVFTFKAGFFFRFHPRPHYPIDQLNACEFHNSCDPEEGVKQAQKLKAELEAALSPFNVQVWGGGGANKIHIGWTWWSQKKTDFFYSMPSFCIATHYTHLQVEHGLGELEILPKFLHKGSFVRRVLELSVEAHQGLSPDMVLVVGDDVVDEKMFTAAFAHVAAQAAKPPPSRG